MNFTDTNFSTIIRTTEAKKGWLRNLIREHQQLMLDNPGQAIREESSNVLVALETIKQLDEFISVVTGFKEKNYNLEAVMVSIASRIDYLFELRLRIPIDPVASLTHAELISYFINLIDVFDSLYNIAGCLPDSYAFIRKVHPKICIEIHHQTEAAQLSIPSPN